MSASQRGFTLLEMLTAVTVLGIILGIAVPSFAELTVQNRAAAQTNEFVSMLAVARSEAVRRGAQVTVLPVGTGWESGWRVFFDADEDQAFDDDGNSTPCEAGEDCTVVHRQDALPGGVTLRVTSGDEYTDYIRFDAIGAAEGSHSGSRDLRLCPSGTDTTKARTVTLESVGRARLAQGAASCP